MCVYVCSRWRVNECDVYIYIYIYIYIYMCMQRMSDGMYALIYLDTVFCANVNARSYELCLCLCWIERQTREEINAFNGREK